MSHEIETYTDADGKQHAFAVFGDRQPAWHTLGEVLPGSLSAADVLDKGHLGGWGVRRDKTPVLDNEGNPVEGFYAVTRKHPMTNKRQPFGVVGGVWEPIQNEDLLDVLEAIFDGGYRVSSAGSLRGGRAVFVCSRFPEDILVGGVDPVGRFFTLLNYHDGTGKLLGVDSQIRVVCANTENAALRNAKSVISIRHTKSAPAAIAEVRRALGIAFAQDDAFQAEAERMIQTTMSEAQFVKAARKVWPARTLDGNGKRSFNIFDRREKTLIDLFHDSDGTNTAIKGTRWGGYNAVTGYVQWHTPFGAKRSSQANAVRALRTVTPNSVANETMAKAFATFRVPAKATA